MDLGRREIQSLAAAASNIRAELDDPVPKSDTGVVWTNALQIFSR